MRYCTYYACLVLTIACLVAALWVSAWWGIGVALFAAFAALGSWDLVQPHHNLMRNYPLVSHVRWVLEAVRPQLRQYFFEGDEDGTPFPRDQRALVYQRSKNVNDARPFGTELDVYANGFEWINHSIAPHPEQQDGFRIDIGGQTCTRPYAASVFNISAMSFGALSANAIRALNRGARLGHFAHDTGEGGLSIYHRENGGDLIWELGSGYFGCRTKDGHFDADRFRDTAQIDQVKMVEIKLSQGAKPGHGGVLPAAKVSREISAARGVPMGQDCVSPSAHSAFSTPTGLLQFVQRLRELSGGKPTGFKLCIGHPLEFMAIAKAMLETQILPDFIVVDGSEGGTGAAPYELVDHVGTPLREGLIFVCNVLTGVGLREQIRVGASGKIISGFGLASNFALGADWCNAARGFMFALGCVQSLKCHTNRCPTGIATQDPRRQKAIVVPDKAQRVANYHQRTIAALAGIVAAAGLDHPAELTPAHLCRRTGANTIQTAESYYEFLRPRQLIDGGETPLQRYWTLADPARFCTVSTLP
ncbi:MAG TPA: FMN-binding glutamate synthase family protein [Nevskiaceae bacterium]|nr:FMN-binding glutamate synthase family protein [Nevskiaceae bacterium]